MPITTVNSVLVYSAKTDRWSSDKTGVFGMEDFAIADSTDPTKQLQFDCSGITASSPITLTPPSESGTLSTLSAPASIIAASAPTAGQTVTVAAGTRYQLVNPSGTLATLTVALPAGVAGKLLSVSFSQIITTLTLTAAGADTIVTDMVAAAAGDVLRVLFTSGKWYRV